MDDKSFIQLGTPYIVKANRLNLAEVVFRAGYHVPLNADLRLITSVHLDTSNRDLIFGCDLQVEWREVISFLAGGDWYIHPGGILLDIKPFALSYTYALNYREAFDHVPAHQLSVSTQTPTRR